MKKLTLAIISLAIAGGVHAEAPANYYKSLNGLKDAELKTAVFNLVRGFTQVSSYNNLPSYFQRTDVYPQSERWWDMYSDIPFYAPSFRGLNREHSFPKSWWGGLTGVSAYVDLNHLYPAEADANMAKSNYPLGELSTTVAPKFDNGISRVGYPATGQGGGCQYVFEPADEYKGDFARTYFYMATCYQDLTWKYTYMVSQNTYPTLNGWAAKLLLQWSRQDEVSDKEKNRNDVVYSIQNNRNPFIDLPELAEYIWGDKVGQPFVVSSSTITGDPELITPTQGMALDFGQVAVGASTTSKLLFRGENLTGNLDLVITGTDKKLFTIPSTTLSATKVNSPEGTWLTVTYKPSTEGIHEAKLIISEGGMLGGSRGITLRGECLPVPTLTACTATDASEIDSDSYLANWTYPENETIDYWVITRTKYVGGSSSQEEILAENPGWEITGFSESDSEAYSVQSVRLGYKSPMSNVVFVSHNAISSAEAEQGLIVSGFDGIIRFNCSAPQTNARIFDIAGKTILEIDEITDNMEIELPAGIYFVTTAQNKSLHKVAVR